MSIRIEDGRVVTVDLPRFTRVLCLCSPGDKIVARGEDFEFTPPKRRYYIHCHSVPMLCMPFVYAGKCHRCNRVVGITYHLKPAEEIPSGLTKLTREHCTEEIVF